MTDRGDVTQLLAEAGSGNRAVLDELFPIVYDELRRIAHGRLQRERPGHTLDTTALVHEAYLKLVDLDRLQWQGRAHFFAVASRAMRNILVNYALKRKADKRGGGARAVTFDESYVFVEEHTEELLALETALRRLEEFEPRCGQVVTYRFFGGMTIEETAEALGVAPATVKRDWTMARAWLNRELSP